MARYQFTANGATYGQPKRLVSTLLKVREVCKRDGRAFRLKTQDGQWSRKYKYRPPFLLAVRKMLRGAKVGDLSKVSTRNDSPTELGKVYFVRKVAFIRDTPGEKAIQAGMSELGTHYRFGVANGPEDPGEDAFDCSGLTEWAWEVATNNAIHLPHNANAQKDSSLVSLFFDQSKAARGDLVFMWFPNSRDIIRPNASHVGLFYAHPTVKTPALMLDTRNPINEPVAIRPIEAGSVVGYGRVRAT